eukprot:TRINITY_DN3261_c0_g2_i2.p2 TRINITY_DN3261_c0_g2~~TRINITY_DN3261_c0_g2_i2.p2  ORF type:complete len:117 (+),score=12.31 TRINITY_DN3261_c0_g2_i2:1205-1555(+)
MAREKTPFFQSVTHKGAPIGTNMIANIRAKHLKAVGVPSKFTSHSIRMAAATALIDKGMTVDEVMTLGGWSSRRVFLQFFWNVNSLSGWEKKQSESPTYVPNSTIDYMPGRNMVYL